MTGERPNGGRPNGGRFRRIDDQWLPGLAGRAQRWAVAARDVTARAAGPHSPSGEAARAEPALAGSIAAVLVAALLIGIFGPHEPTDRDNGPVQQTGAVAPPQQTLGPRPGASVPNYLRDASFSLRRFGETSHGRPGYALVNLGGYRTPAQVTAIFRGLDVIRAYVRVPSPTLATAIYPVSLRDTFGDLLTGMQSQSRFAGLNAKTYAQIVAGFNAHTDREKQEKRLYAALAVAAKYESSALGQPQTCVCVFAMVVHATFPQLSVLARTPDVRSIDPAGPSLTLDELSVSPLRPEDTKVVPRPGVLGVR